MLDATDTWRHCLRKNYEHIIIKKYIIMEDSVRFCNECDLSDEICWNEDDAIMGGHFFSPHFLFNRSNFVKTHRTITFS